jgi:beta-fructofuranosidase
MITRRRFLLQSTLAAGALWAHRSGSALAPRLAADPDRPQYHFLPKANWVNDPNGPIFWNGYHHLFYQYSSTVSPQGPKYWGHARSRDMVYWEHLPMALAPTPGGPDKDGCWSGSAFINQGVPTLVYTGVFPQVQCLAASDDGMMTWKKHAGNPVVTPPAGLNVTGFRDPSIWREGDTWLLTVGAGFKGQGGAVLLFASRDLVHWDYLHPLYAAPPFEPPRPARSADYEAVGAGDMWECPDFFPLGSKHVLLVSTEGRVHYVVGTYSQRRFHAETHGLVDGSGLHYAAKTLVDGGGRRVLWGWVVEARSGAAQNAAGWSGAISLPRVLSVAADGALRMEPLPELARLRNRRVVLSDVDVQGDHPLAAVGGRALEIRLVMDIAGAKPCGIGICRSPQAEEETTIAYDAASGSVVLDTGRSSLNPDVSHRTSRAALKLSAGEPLRLTVFLDGSVVEVFANGTACVTGRVYPTRADSTGVSIFTREGKARVKTLELYELKAISPDRLTA